MLLPIVERENDRLRGLRSDVKRLLTDLESGRATDAQRQHLLALARRYRVNGKILEEAEARRDLLTRIDTIPSALALALAQAANESAWGSSRFAREGNNLFGIWTYDESKGMVPKGRPQGAKYLVRKFENYDASVRYYLHTLNSHPAYQPLRDARAQARSQGKQPEATKLAAGLVRYSAKGELYVKLIRQLIARYQLAGLVAENRRAG
jgi:Bax protein